jgi:hypothetical protein
LEVMVTETFNGFGWRHRLRLQGWFACSCFRW